MNQIIHTENKQPIKSRMVKTKQGKQATTFTLMNRDFIGKNIQPLVNLQ